MKVSYKWLKRYFDDGALPAPETLADTITFRAFELEDVIDLGKDTVLDIDVLPNRSSDCLCHRGIARELATLLNEPMKSDPYLEPLPEWKESNKLKITIDEESLVNRFSAVVMQDVKIGKSPDWLKHALEAIGQKSINNVVDATNYVMFSLGQPLHAFDADKLTQKEGAYEILVRNARAGEKITTLTGEEYELDESNLLIVDGNNDAGIGIAGVKGGQVAEVDDHTKNIILEAANFNYVSVRKTSQKLKLITDASVRFQNEPVRALTTYALRDVVALILDIAGGEIEGAVDWNPHPETKEPVTVTTEQCNTHLGITLTDNDVAKVCDQFNWQYEQSGSTFTVTPPFERTDLNITEDLIEEVGRVHGYEHVEAVLLPALSDKPEVNTLFYFSEKIRMLLVEELDFSEVLTYTLRDHGKVELANALASDKSFMRADLREGIDDALTRNIYNAPLLGLTQVKIFEIGTIFTKDGERMSLAIGARFPKKIKGTIPDDIVREAVTRIEEKLGVKTNAKVSDGIAEINFDKVIEQAGDASEYVFPPVGADEKRYQPFSPYPFMLRDIAVWVTEGVKAEDLHAITREHAGELLVRCDLFDEFTKDGKTSYAFHLVFQSKEKTLSDEEVNKIMDDITGAMNANKGWEVR